MESNFSSRDRNNNLLSFTLLNFVLLKKRHPLLDFYYILLSFDIPSFDIPKFIQ
jgi:hypothetical protein